MTRDSTEEQAKEESRPEEADSTKDEGGREGIAAESKAADGSPAGGAGQKPEAGKAHGEEDEGWPKSWIVTTAILGIVAIIIIARLVGQSWKRDDPIGRPPGFKDEKQGKEFPPGKRPFVGGHGSQLQAATGTVVAEGKNLKTMTGRQCLGTDGKLYALELRKDPPAKCLLDAKRMLGYRVEMSRPEPMSEITLMVLPAKRGEQQYFSRYMVLPYRGDRFWFGVSHVLTAQPMVVLALEANISSAVHIDTLRIAEQQRPKRPLGEAVAKLELKEIEFPTGGIYCLTPGKKVILMKTANDDPPKECMVKVEGGSVFHLELTRETFRGELMVALERPGKESPPLIDAFIHYRPPAEKMPEWVQGQIFPSTKELAVVVNAVTNTGFKIGSILFEVVR